MPVHLEYILTEILKNSFRATVENYSKLQHGNSTKALPPVLITISPPQDMPEISGPKFMSMRIRDEGGGVSAANMAKIFSYAFTTAGQAAEDDSGGGPYAAQYVGGSAAVGSGGSGEGNVFGEITEKGLQTGMGTIAGLGYGLPMSRLYAKSVNHILAVRAIAKYVSDILAVHSTFTVSMVGVSESDT